MKREDHLTADRAVFGKEFNEVHQWIDSEFAKYSGYRHWLEKHHEQAIFSKYGDSPEAQSAKLHVLMDFVSHWNEPYLPKTRSECFQKLHNLRDIHDGT